VKTEDSKIEIEFSLAFEEFMNLGDLISDYTVYIAEKYGENVAIEYLWKISKLASLLFQKYLGN